MHFIISIFIVYGISAIITISKLFEPLRDYAEKRSPDFWKHLTSCMQCLPFWVGIFVSYVLGVPIMPNNETLPGFVNTFLGYLFSGALYSGTTLLIHTIFVRLKGKAWEEREAAERQRKLNKGIIK